MNEMKIWELVRQTEEKKDLLLSDIEEVRTIMIFNFGKYGMCHANIINEEMSLTTMIYETFNFYEKRLREEIK